MTKAKARQRAKAKAAEKAKKRQANADRSEPKSHTGKFDPSVLSIKSAGVNTNVKSFGAAKRGAARSR